MIWTLLLACGSEPAGTPIGPLVLPVAEHASAAALTEYAGVLEIGDGEVRLSGQVVPEDLVPEALLALRESTPRVPHTLLLAVDERASYARVMGLVYVAGMARFTRFDILVEDATPDAPAPKAAATQTLLVGPAAWQLDGVELSAEAALAAIPNEPRDTILAVSADVPWRETVRAHDRLAATGSRVVYGLGDDVEAAPFATSGGGGRPAREVRLIGEIAVLPIHVPRADAHWAPPPEPQPAPGP